MWQLGGVTFHWYGLVIGLAIVIASWLVHFQAKRQQIPVSEVETAFGWAVAFGLVGARIYHVLTDFHLYQADPLQMLYFWQGGLSVIGALAGGVIGVWVGIVTKHVSLNLLTVLDLSVFGLPVAQAVGRWGNWINQELYGPPSTLPWAIAIEPHRRLPGYEQFERFHPLFLYESMAMIAFAGGLWWLSQRGRLRWKLGSGRYFLVYILYYSLVRFLLDFLRLDKATSGVPGLGLNQLVLLGVMIGIVIAWNWLLAKNYE